MNKQKWLNSSWSKLYWEVQKGSFSKDCFTCLCNLLSPTLIKKRDYVFLKENFSEDYTNLAIENGMCPEYWTNLVPLDEILSELGIEPSSSKPFLIELVKNWKKLLSLSFPKLDFEVEDLYDLEFDECAITFYQPSIRSQWRESLERHKIPKPNMKEWFPENTVDGKTLKSLPFLRFPLEDETPKETV